MKEILYVLIIVITFAPSKKTLIWTRWKKISMPMFMQSR